MNKKGAVELSMTTIIIIIIGITILSLGLVWIRSVFSDVGDLTSSAFEQGDAQIAEIFAGTEEDVALTPTSISIEQGDSSTATLSVNHMDSGEVTVGVTSEVNALGSGDSDNILCVFADSGDTESQDYDLDSGQGMTITIFVEDQGSDVGDTYSCVMNVEGLVGGDESESLIITIE